MARRNETTDISQVLPEHIISNWGYVFDANLHTIAKIVMEDYTILNFNLWESFGKRLANCYNVCTGLTNKELESGLTVRSLQARIKELEGEN